MAALVCPQWLQCCGADTLSWLDRCLAAVGTLATINTESREYVKEVGLGDVAQSRLGSPGRAGEAARELLQLLA